MQGWHILDLTFRVFWDVVPCSHVLPPSSGPCRIFIAQMMEAVSDYTALHPRRL
jgi:hypothetical protein